MEYGLWNLHGSFWAGNNPCVGGDRSIYNAASSANQRTEAATSFTNVSTASPCRTSYRHQTEYIAMKPAVISSRSSTDAESAVQPRVPSRNVEVMPLHSDLLTEHSEQESGNSNTMTINSNPQSSSTTASPETSTTNIIKKGKMSKSSRKHGSNAKSDSSLPAQYLNQQYNPMYSMMFGRTSLKRDTTSDESEDEDDDGDNNADDNANDIDNYSNESSPTGSQSPQRSVNGFPRSGYECGQCDLVADTRPALKKHISLCHPGPDSDHNTLVHKVSGSCPMPTCNFRSLSRDELETHVARHVADGFQRHSSSKKRNNTISLQRVRYEREEYRCQICSYTCTIEKAFYKHLKLHSMGLNVPAVKISCVICGKDRPSEVEMNKHMRKHRDSRYFCCDVCIFRTVQLKKLIQHRRMHTGEKPHLCPHCAYRSARRDNLRSHVRRVHKKDNLFCDTFSPRGLLLSSSAQPASPSDSLQ